jgi:protein-tyrosine kinase
MFAHQSAHETGLPGSGIPDSGIRDWAAKLRRRQSGMREKTARPPAARLALPPPAMRPPSHLVAGARPHGLASGELVKLHHSLIESLDTDRGIIAQFVGPEPDSAIRDVVYDLAYVSADWLGKRVLFVDGTGMTQPGKARAVAPRRDQPPHVTGGLDDVEATITRVVGLELYQMTFPSLRGALDLAPSVRRIPEFLSKLRDSFEMVLIAAPAASEAPMAMLLSRFVDGNVLVLEAGRTRAPVALELRDSLRTSGGAIIGAVLTRYDSFVPRFLRRWL